MVTSTKGSAGTVDFENPSLKDQEDLLDILKIDYTKNSFIGSYVGNGSVAGGPFIYLGFKASKVLVKNCSTIENWETFVPATVLSFSNPILYDGFKVPSDLSKKDNQYTIIGIA